MKLLRAMMSVDRRIIFLLMAAAVTIPLLFPLNLGVEVTETALLTDLIGLFHPSHSWFGRYPPAGFAPAG